MPAVKDHFTKLKQRGAKRDAYDQMRRKPLAVSL
jgi:hypothetical protein